MTTPPELLIGIDLGTTNSLVAVLAGSSPTLIPNALGDVLTPSVVSVDEGGEILVGDRPSALPYIVLGVGGLVAIVLIVIALIMLF